MNFEKVENNDSYGVDFNSIEEIENDIKTNYNLPGHPIAYSGIDNIFRYYKGKIDKEKIKNILSSIDNYTLHKQYRSGQRNNAYSHFLRQRFEIDLVDISNLAEYNDGVTFLLVAIDTFSRYAFVRLLTNKKAETVLTAFKSILQEAKKYPITVSMDRGTEFSNKLFVQFCKDNNIRLFSQEDRKSVV